MPTAIFDLDGTLVDSLPDILAALNVTLAGFGAAPVTLKEGASMVGAGARRLVARGLTARAIPFDDSKLADAFHRFVANYDAMPCVHTRLYPDVVHVLEGMRAEGWKLGVCTNKPQSTADLVIDALGVRHLFGTITGGREGIPLKPASDMINRALEELGSPLLEAIMVGDSEADVGAARAAGIPVILLSYGYTGGEPVRALGADIVIDRFAELPQAIASLQSRNLELRVSSGPAG